MGTAIGDLLTSRQIAIGDLKGKILAVDTYNMLYQFLTTIRMRDGSPLKDSHGNVTSHIMGLSTRIPKLMHNGVKFVFVFDGEPPKLKQAERERRAGLKKEAQKSFEEAKKKEDFEEMKKYAARTTRLNEEMVEEAKEFISALGAPIIQAPSEGEAQASFLVKKGKAFAILSQDFDSLNFGAPKLLRNLSIAGKRKKTSAIAYETISPEIIDLAENLNNLGIDRDQLIALSMLVGTDYNIGGIKGIGPKNALKLVKQFGKDFDSLFRHTKWNDYFDYRWEEVYHLIKKMPVKEDCELKWSEPDSKKIFEVLCEKHDFARERVNSIVEEFEESRKTKPQRNLGEFFR